jgi:hypothetical protein
MGPSAEASHVLTGECKNRANFDRLVSTKTFSNARFRLLPEMNFEKFFHAAAIIPFKLIEQMLAHHLSTISRETNSPWRDKFRLSLRQNLLSCI